MKETFNYIVFLIVSSVLCAFSLPQLSAEKKIHSPVISQESEIRYLPKGPGLVGLSLGYKNALADLLLFNAMNYFGKHYQSDKSYNWLFHMCDLITTLDPKNTDVFIFGTFMLGWEANAPNEALALINKSIRLRPDDWTNYYIRGFIYYFLLHDTDSALNDFKVGTTKPGAPSIMATIAAKELGKSSNDPQATVDFLEEMIQHATDPITRSVLENRLKEAKKKLN